MKIVDFLRFYSIYRHRGNSMRVAVRLARYRVSAYFH